RDFKGKLAVMRSAEKGKALYPDGSRSRIWGASNNVFKTGPAVSLNLNCTPNEQIDWLRREKPAYLMTPRPICIGLRNTAWTTVFVWKISARR
ncbi:MAG: hypothetical protein JKY68_05255, partial [Rhodospirillales bacterium]|nr:hypothetical protein [Rhodospirillales bacterium]